MKLGLRAHDFGRQSAESLAASIAAAGFECCQLAPAKAIDGIEHFNDITDEHLENIREGFLRHNIEITVLGCYIEPSFTEQDKRLEQVEIFCTNLTNAKKLGVSIVGTETTGLSVDTPTAEREKRYQLLKDSVERMVERAEKEEVFIGIEPVAVHTLNSAELARRLLDEVKSKWLKIIFDPVNLILPETVNNQLQIFQSVLDLLGNDIVAMHIKDIVIEGDKKIWRNIGQGVVDYSTIAEWLRANKPDMRLLREEVKPDSYKICMDAMRAFTVQ